MRIKLLKLIVFFFIILILTSILGRVSVFAGNVPLAICSRTCEELSPSPANPVLLYWAPYPIDANPGNQGIAWTIYSETSQAATTYDLIEYFCGKTVDSCGLTIYSSNGYNNAVAREFRCAFKNPLYDSLYKTCEDGNCDSVSDTVTSWRVLVPVLDSTFQPNACPPGNQPIPRPVVLYAELIISEVYASSGSCFRCACGAYDAIPVNGPNAIEVIGIQCYGCPYFPNISVTPTSHNFGNVTVGSSSVPQTFNISNVGNVLFIEPLSISGTDKFEFMIQGDNCSGMILMPLWNCTIDVMFSPASGGSKNANLSITSNDPDTPTLDVPLNGTGIPLGNTPSAPSNLVASSVSASAIKLTWTDNSTDETSFKIYRKKDSGSWKLIATKEANVVGHTNWTATGNTTTTTYSYYVKACNNNGCSPSTKWATVPYRPITLTATASSSNQIDLTWIDTSYNETGFQIYRKKGNCSSVDPWVEITTTGPNITSYSDIGLTSGITYSYKVRAYKQSSNTPYAYGYSLYTGCKSVTTP